ncbi:hypothetical protein [Bosea sp. BIWAKO-01]|uniref:hypothetical protein n=1 Tax=Bosea sp. BIWAKO-01 TaxID=506668 RepID=UPI000853A1D5|nr:hypothetical protein [Bosea sp. BIWAKO-01]GAU85175.1 hypothetical protein BIWAKO_05119 [Bosea sp. BIWAKO-01]
MNARPRWRTVDAARAADAPYRHFSTLIDRGIFHLAENDVATTGPGISRELTRESIYRLAVTAALARAGINYRLAASIVDDFAATGADDAFPVHLLADLAEGGRLISVGEPAGIAIAANLGPLLAAVESRLSQMDPIP